MKLTSKELRKMILREFNVRESVSSGIDAFSEATWRVAEELKTQGWEPYKIGEYLKSEIDSVVEDLTDMPDYEEDYFGQ